MHIIQYVQSVFSQDIHRGYPWLEINCFHRQVPVKTEGSVRRLVKAAERCGTLRRRRFHCPSRLRSFPGRGGGRGRCEALGIREII